MLGLGAELEVDLLGGEVDRAFADPAIRAFVDALWDEAAPTLEPGLDTASYTAELAERFANPALAHRTAQIANDGSQKLPQRILETALDRFRAGRSADHLVLVVAAWIAACEARGRSLPDAHFTDPLDRTMADLAVRNLSAADMAAAVFDAAGFATGRPERAALVEVTARHLESLRARGPAATLAGLAATRTS